MGDEPIVFRTFMHDAGVRAIACGFPEHIHYAFDPDRCTLALVCDRASSTRPRTGRRAAEARPIRHRSSGVREGTSLHGSTGRRPAGRACPAGSIRGYQLDRRRRSRSSVRSDGRRHSVQGDGAACAEADQQQGVTAANITIEGPASAIVTVTGGTSPGQGGRIVLGGDGRATSQIEVTW